MSFILLLVIAIHFSQWDLGRQEGSDCFMWNMNEVVSRWLLVVSKKGFGRLGLLVAECQSDSP